MTLTRDRKTDLLSKARLFDGVDAEGMDRIAAVAVEVEFPAGHVINRQGEIGTGFFVVVSGEVRVVREGAELARWLWDTGWHPNIHSLRRSRTP